MLAPNASGRDHPAVLILFVLASELIAALYLMAITMLVGALAFHFLVWRRTNLPLGPVRTAAGERISELVLRCGKWTSLALFLLAVPRAVDRWHGFARAHARSGRGVCPHGLRACGAGGRGQFVRGVPCRLVAVVCQHARHAMHRDLLDQPRG